MCVCGRNVCWQKAFPEYGASYGFVLKAIEKVERDLPGLYYAGGAHAVASNYSEFEGRVFLGLRRMGN